MQSESYLRQEYTIATPENVSFGYEVVGIGNRFIAALVDSIILALILTVMNIIGYVIIEAIGGPEAILTSLSDDVDWQTGLAIALVTLVNFAIIWGYFILFEWLWQGQTPGKRWAKIRVVRLDGNPVGLGEVVIRNLMRIIDFLPSSYALGFVVMFLNQHARRLGDFAAGTLVVKDRSLLKLADLGSKLSSDSQVSKPAAASLDDESDPLYMRFLNIRSLEASDVILIDEIINRHSRGQIDPLLLKKATRQLARKIALPAEEIDTITSSNGLDLLKQITQAYRRYGQ